MTRRRFVNWLRGHVPPERWEQVWWLTPALTLLLLPVGAPILQLLMRLGWDGAPRATQGLMVLSVLSGVAVGSVVLWSVKEAGLEPGAYNRAQWLARFAILGPFLTLLVMFGIAKIT